MRRVRVGVVRVRRFWLPYRVCVGVFMILLWGIVGFRMNKIIRSKAIGLQVSL